MYSLLTEACPVASSELSVHTYSRHQLADDDNNSDHTLSVDHISVLPTPYQLDPDEQLEGTGNSDEPLEDPCEPSRDKAGTEGTGGSDEPFGGPLSTHH